jgi:hypothetical protein
MTQTICKSPYNLISIFRYGETPEQVSNSDKLLSSIIQARCLSKEQDRITNGGPKAQSHTTQNDYYENVDMKSSDAIKSTNDSKLRKSVTSNKERDPADTRSKTKEPTDSAKARDKEDEIDKPWISYLRNLRIPMMCQLHRKITYTISDNALKASPPQSKAKRDKSPATIKRRQMNRNPNCNHNSKLQ